MDELIKRVGEKAGLPPDRARAAVDAVLSFLKEKLPGPIGSHLDGVLGGGGGGGGIVDEVKKGLGGLFGK